MKEVQTLLDNEVLTVEKLKQLLEQLPEEMIVADIYLGKLIETTRVAVYSESENSDEFLVIG